MVDWTTCKMLLFCSKNSGSILIMSWSCKKRFQAIPAYTFAFRRSLGMRLKTHLTVGAFCCVQCSLPSCAYATCVHCVLYTYVEMLVWTGIHKHITRRFSGTLTLLTFFCTSKFSHQFTLTPIYQLWNHIGYIRVTLLLRPFLDQNFHLHSNSL